MVHYFGMMMMVNKIEDLQQEIANIKEMIELFIDFFTEIDVKFMNQENQKNKEK